MNDKQRGEMIGRIASTLCISCNELNETNPYKAREFDAGNTFFTLAFMSDKNLSSLDRRVHGGS